MVTVTTLAEAREAAARGASALALQGPEAGGHRGTWSPDAAPGTTPLLDLLAQVVAAVEAPVVAGGGVRDHRDVHDLLARGAAAAQVGTGYLLADEASGPTRCTAPRWWTPASPRPR